MLQFNIVLSKEAQWLAKNKKNLEEIGNADILDVCLESLSFITLEMLNVENKSYVFSRVHESEHCLVCSGCHCECV